MNPPASREQIREAEQALGVRLPDDLGESYRCHNGQQADSPGIAFGLTVVPLAECVGHWRGWVEGYAENLKDGSAAGLASACSCFPHDYVRQAYFDKGWVPLTYDSSGNHIGVDLDPGPRGPWGQVVVFGRDDIFHLVLAQSWGQFLTDLADELEQGNFRTEGAGQAYPEFTLDDPYRTHFHQAGIYWSRGKLGLKRLSRADEVLWRKRHRQ